MLISSSLPPCLAVFLHCLMCGKYFSIRHCSSNLPFDQMSLLSHLELSPSCPRQKAWAIMTGLDILVLIGSVVCGSIVAGALFNPYSVRVCRGEGGWKCLSAAECNAGHHPGQRRTATHHVHPVQGAFTDHDIMAATKQDLFMTFSSLLQKCDPSCCFVWVTAFRLELWLKNMLVMFVFCLKK